MKALSIAVGYTWADGTPRSDVRWRAISAFAKAAAETGRKSAAAALRSAVTAEDEEQSAAQEDGSVPRVTVTRLRATAGGFIWENITRRIREADILIFDVTAVANERAPKGRTSNNVWLEIGYALALPGKQVFVVHADSNAHRTVIPSDLSGLLIGQLPDDARAVDTSLRASLAAAVRRRILEAVEELAAIVPERPAPNNVSKVSKPKRSSVR